MHFPSLPLKKHTDIRILVSFLGLAAVSFVFFKVASEVVEGDTLAFDQEILRGLRNPTDLATPIGPAWLESAIIDLTALGGTTALTLLTILTAGYFLVRQKYGTAAFIIVAISGGAIVSSLLKLLFSRDRPDVVAHLVDVHNASFPSGHAMNSAVTFLTIGALLARAEDARLVKVYLIVAAISLTLMIGLSRLYLGVHWPSDVIAGWCVGAAWAVLCSLVARVLQIWRAIEAPTSSQGEQTKI